MVADTVPGVARLLDREMTWLPNGSRVSGGRNARGRKAAERGFKRMLGARLRAGSALGVRLRTIKHARRIAEDPLTFPEARRSWLPASLQTGLQQLLSCRSMIPDGDRRHGSVSRDVVGEVERSVEWH